MKRYIAILLILILTTAFTSCKKTTQCEFPELYLTLSLPKDAKYTENEASLNINLTDEILVLVSVSDAAAYVDGEYSELPPEQLDMECGAFNANLNNYAYVSEMFNYLFSDAQRSYTICGITQTIFSERDYHAYCAQFISESDDLNGYIYLTVQNARCYIFCFYISSKLIEIYDYSEPMDDFLLGVVIS